MPADFTETLQQNAQTIQRMREMLRDGAFGLSSSSQISLSKSFAYPEEEGASFDILRPKTTKARPPLRSIFDRRLAPNSSSIFQQEESESLLRNQLSPIAH